MTRIARGMTHISTLGILAIALVLVLFVVVWLKPKPQPIPDRERTSIDSLAATQPHFDTVRIERVRTETLYVRRSSQEALRAIGATHVADSLRRVADELTRAAATSDERSSRWFEVAEVRKVENDSLRSANTSLSYALTDATTARVAASERADAAGQRLAATADLSRRLATDVKRGDCRVLVVLSCPSRRATLAIGLTGGAIAAIAIDRRVGR